MEGILLDESSRVASFDGKKRETRDIDKFERRTSFFFRYCVRLEFGATGSRGEKSISSRQE